jgi:hypothetical protein
MKDRKEKLIGILSRAIHSLKSGIVEYDWVQQSSCNCGVVLQAATGMTALELQKEWSREYNSAAHSKKFIKAKSWRAFVQATCSATGIPVRGVLLKLYGLGVSPEDISHLEFMNNEAILAKSGISKAPWYSQEEIKEKTTDTNAKGTWAYFRRGAESFTTPASVEKKEHPYHQSEKNLILYLTAWKAILKEDVTQLPENKDTMRRQLLQAVASEDYKVAATLRDKLSD